MPELTPIQSQVLAGLLAGGSIAAVAREHKIHRSTIYNWQHDHSAFTYALKEARARHRAAMHDAAQDLTARAYETLGALLASDKEQTRLRAAQVILRSTSGVDRAVNRASRNEAIRRIEPADRALLQSTSARPNIRISSTLTACRMPLRSVNRRRRSSSRTFDTFRHNSTHALRVAA
jgi:transposase-like protein